MKPIGSDGPIKIGCTSSPLKRLRACEIWSPVQLEIIATAAGSHEEEGFLHAKFSDEWLHGEWFEPSTALNVLIRHVADEGEFPGDYFPSCWSEWVAHWKRKDRKISKRDALTAAEKSKISHEVWEAERYAWGYGCIDERPIRVHMIIENYTGFGQPLPSEEERLILKNYARRLMASRKPSYPETGNRRNVSG